MHLRREVHAILWVLALIALAWALYCATIRNSDDSEYNSNTASADYAEPEYIVSTNAFEPRRLIAIPSDARTLFQPPAMQASASALPMEPVLKGILMSGSGLRAVFMDPANGTYRTAGEGEMVGALQLLRIGADRVVVQSTSGNRVLYLRGAGEHP